MEILRFGPGFRRPRTREGGIGLTDGTIWVHPGARITELAFSRRALLPPQTSPDMGLFIVVAGGGWVQIGEERTAINHGEAVEWPPSVPHGAWTDGSTMRAILVEVPDRTIAATPARLVHASEVPGLEPARGRLARPEVRPEDHDQSEGEPW